MEGSVAELVTRETLRRLAGAGAFERGQEYAASGAVGPLRADLASISADVQGTERYHVRLELADRKLVGSCTCPVGRERLFCKHCVAVGLASLGDEQDVASGLRDRLVALGAEALADLLVDQALDDERLLARLVARTADPSEPPAHRLQRVREAFDMTVERGGFVPWGEAYGFTQALSEMVDAVEAELGASDEAGILAFCEHALHGLAETSIDDSAGELADITDRLEGLHLAACRMTRPDARPLAERLFRLEVDDGLDAFAGAAERYADVLGDTGVARYRELAEAGWSAEPALGPGRTAVWGDRRERLEHVMEGLARLAGDVDALVAVLARDRSRPYRYHRIATELLEAGRTDEATAWAERGLAAFPDLDGQLVDFLCDRYGETGRHDDAVELAHRALERSPRGAEYRRLAAVASLAGVWPSLRDQGRDLLRRAAGGGHGRGDRSELVGALLWEGEPDAAWREAKEGGCDRRLWLGLARAREREHPEDAVEVYLAQLEPAIRVNDGHTYDGAVEWLEQIRALLVRLDRLTAFDELVMDVRRRHRAKRNLIKRLDERGWGTR